MADRRVQLRAAQLESRPARRGRKAARRSAPETAKRSRILRALCVEDHALLVDGLRAQFAIDGGIDVVGWLPTAAKLLEETRRLRPDIVLLDIEMPGPDVFEMARRLHDTCPDVRVIVLSAHVRDSFISAAFRAGACAYFAKSDRVEEIVAAIHQIARARHSGDFILGKKVREQCAPSVGTVMPKPNASRDTRSHPRAEDGRPETVLGSLTPREAEILRLIGKGLTRSQIAAQLCRSVKTIDGHQKRMMRKLKVEGRTGLVRLAIREGLVQA